MKCVVLEAYHEVVSSERMSIHRVDLATVGTVHE